MSALILSLLLLLPSCAFVERAGIENQRRLAEVEVMRAYRDLTVAAAVKIVLGGDCVAPPPMVSISHKTGEPDQSLLALPSLKDMVLP